MLLGLFRCEPISTLQKCSIRVAFIVKLQIWEVILPTGQRGNGDSCAKSNMVLFSKKQPNQVKDSLQRGSVF